MYFDYYAVGASTPVHTKITDVELAKYIATDWLPGTPISIMNGFADVLRGVLETENLKNYQKQHCDYWCVNRDLALTDRQWKGVTSWLLGVAFTRFTVESAGYPWWSPVSAFKGTRSTGSTTTGNWLIPHPRSEFLIQRKLNWPSTLYPDYVLCRPTSKGYAYAFCESKGTKKSIAQSSWSKPPHKWSNQVQTLDLFFNGQPLPIAEHLIVATKVNPQAIRASTRRIVVRAWDIKAQTLDDSDAIKFACFLATHYAALCRRLGHNELAQLLDYVAKQMSERASASSATIITGQRNLEALSEMFPRAYTLLFNSESMQNIPGAAGLTLLKPGETPMAFQLGARLFNIAFTSQARDIMQAIINFHPNELRQVAIQTVNELQGKLESYRNDEQQNVAVTLNGLAVFERPAA